MYITQATPRGLVYTEIDRSSLLQHSKQSTFLSLDDNRIEYAQLKINPQNNSDLSATQSGMVCTHICNAPAYQLYCIMM